MPKKAPPAKWCSECGELTDHLSVYHNGNKLIKAIQAPKQAFAPIPIESDTPAWYSEKPDEPLECFQHDWVIAYDFTNSKDVVSCIACGEKKQEALCDHAWTAYKFFAPEDLYVSDCVKCGEKKSVAGDLTHKHPCKHKTWAFLNPDLTQCTSCGMISKPGVLKF